MSRSSSGTGRYAVAIIGALFTAVTLWTGPALATITQGDFSIFGNFREHAAGRWGEGGEHAGTPTTFGSTGVPGTPGTHTGGSFDFNHWDLVELKSLADIRPDYHLVKNYNFLGRLDTVFIKEADFAAIYRASYDAFPDLKPRGVAEPNTDEPKFTRGDKQHWFQNNALREYYAQVNVTDDLSFRIGKQEVIWSEADALSGTEVVNPADLRSHWIHFESPEDQRRNLRMIKMNYVMGDIWETANNEFEAFWIPGDFEGGGPQLNTVDRRAPYFVYLAESRFNGFENTPCWNLEGQPNRQGNLRDCSPTPLVNVDLGSPSGRTPNAFLDFVTPTRTNAPSNSIKHSEFGARYSTLLPIGNGLQISFIYEWLYRANKEGADPNLGPAPACVAANTCAVVAGPNSPAALTKGPGIWAVLNTTAANSGWGSPNPNALPVSANCGVGPTGLTITGTPAARCGIVFLDLYNQFIRSNFFGLTGTYYDKDLTDVVYRYDFAYVPKTGYFANGAVASTPGGTFKTITQAAGKDTGAWTDKAEAIIAFDRPTYIPWISKQHTFLVAQFTESWFPGTHNHPLLSIASAGGKFRKFQSLALVAAVNWLFDGRLTSTNSMLWDVDDNTGFVMSTNAFRYSRNVLFNTNAIWYLGESGRYTDPILLSRSQRQNEVEFRLVYEI